jgi:hypothetical protein
MPVDRFAALRAWVGRPELLLRKLEVAGYLDREWVIARKHNFRR